MTGSIIIAPVKRGNVFSTAELIDESGRKTALYGGQKGGGYWATQRIPEGDGDGLTFAVGEGLATVLSASEATGFIGIAALTVNNLKDAAEELHARYPKARKVLLADAGKEKDVTKALIWLNAVKSTTRPAPSVGVGFSCMGTLDEQRGGARCDDGRSS